LAQLLIDKLVLRQTLFAEILDTFSEQMRILLKEKNGLLDELLDCKRERNKLQEEVEKLQQENQQTIERIQLKWNTLREEVCVMEQNHFNFQQEIIELKARLKTSENCCERLKRDNLILDLRRGFSNDETHMWKYYCQEVKEENSRLWDRIMTLILEHRNEEEQWKQENERLKTPNDSCLQKIEYKNAGNIIQNYHVEFKNNLTINISPNNTSGISGNGNHNEPRNISDVLIIIEKMRNDLDQLQQERKQLESDKKEMKTKMKTFEDRNSFLKEEVSVCWKLLGAKSVSG